MNSTTTRTLQQIEADLAQNKIERTEARRIAGMGGRSGGNARRQHTELLRQAAYLIAERDKLTGTPARIPGL